MGFDTVQMLKVEVPINKSSPSFDLTEDSEEPTTSNFTARDTRS